MREREKLIDIIWFVADTCYESQGVGRLEFAQRMRI
jgi:hypothetical protein